MSYCIHNSPVYHACHSTRSSGAEDERKVPIVSASDTPFETQCVLASCQSLALLDGEVVGDPLEKACLSAINWTVNKGLCLEGWASSCSVEFVILQGQSLSYLQTL